MAKLCRGQIIKFAWRRNLIYPIQLLFWTLVRKILNIILDKEYNFSKNLLFTLLMFFAEFATGLILYLYHKSFLKKKGTISKSKEIFIYTESEMTRPDSSIKIIFLIFIAGYFDFIEFILSTNYVPKFPMSSGSLEIRLGGILIVSSALFFYYLLKSPILRHQFFSLLIIGICLIIIIISEYYFQDINIFMNYGDFSLKMLLIIFEQFFYSLLDSSEKYIIEYDFIDYFLVLSLEGLFGLIITIAYLFSDDTYKIQLIEIYSTSSGGKFALFIFLLFIYIILCGLKNAFRVVTNKIYSPMTKSVTDYFLNPIYLIINYIEGDFVSGGKQNIFYFLLNFILSMIISLCGCVFNEIVILFFCGLEVNTHDQISHRSSLNYKLELSEIDPHKDGIDYDTEDL